MSIKNDTTATTTALGDDEAMMVHITHSTGLSQKEVEGLMMTDDDLDALCDAVLSRFDSTKKKVGG